MPARRSTLSGSGGSAAWVRAAAAIQAQRNAVRVESESSPGASAMEDHLVVGQGPQAGTVAGEEGQVVDLEPA